MINFEHVYKTLRQTRVLCNFSFSAEIGKILCLIGPSGCGKTTILQLLAGLEQPDAGQITGTEDLRVSYVFQEPRLLPWKTVAENMAFVLRGVVPSAGQKELINRYLSMTGLYDYRHSYPDSLSGGMKQRLALCRAFAFPHDLLLLDEPFNSLDVPLRLGLVRQIIRMWQAEPRTIVFVTHDIMDALLLGHRVVVLSRAPAAVLDAVDVDIPLEQRKIGRDPLPACYARIMDLLESE
ncbi:ABC transporter ATP-binding protein [Pelotomaculum isophthalicicum JI]|uniref:ABC transporter ATP-binding protein n=1 Tax=Pelotomaculum isophthalicicum JI TaxID=947010 RepID=A0A9X4H0G0_9FIRM|nr:ABC transporter ATP-binding protein [Pelotomaculum isophthalicicum]MDF9409800.1 ABC transporter ATP-binding protein [Pelotomaculum isophthalicicum JI]